ncbi:hypothetical protein [Wansuia hejianensis]|uniref:Uncharacterized protein n=1 Tax=Wansuia hejianensis TaxID=2763667 RepID=A0A926F1N6_9FIRM|nr:hypothetical protein [Wansuia hejianensis]MBC8590314.1 hypothetical protein [Wansuia hejianensis]
MRKKIKQIINSFKYDEYAEIYLVYGIGLVYHINELKNLVISKDKKYHIYG